jgi:hypothetical protein
VNLNRWRKDKNKILQTVVFNVKKLICRGEEENLDHKDHEGNLDRQAVLENPEKLDHKDQEENLDRQAVPENVERLDHRASQDHKDHRAQQDHRDQEENQVYVVQQDLQAIRKTVYLLHF